MLLKLYLHRNGLTGGWLGAHAHAIPRCKRVSATQYSVTHCGLFPGEIPSELGQLASLQVLWISANHLTGKVPVQHLSTATSLQTLSLGQNDLDDTSTAKTELEELVPGCSVYVQRATSPSNNKKSADE